MDAEPKPTPEHAALSELDLAWLAGVVDALGNVRRRRHGDHGLLILQVCGLSADQVATLAELSGAGATTMERGRVRTKSWTLTGARAYIVLAAVRPYLRLKAELVDEHLAHASRAPWKAATGRKMTDLGWPVPHSPIRSVS